MDYGGEETHETPSDVEAEEQVIGCLLRGERIAFTAVEELGVQREHFFRPAHRLVWDAVHAVRDETGGVEELLVVRKLQAMRVPKGEPGEGEIALGRAGGAPGVLTLAERVVAVSTVRRYVELVMDAARRRRVVEVGHEVARLGYDRTVSGDQATDHAQRLMLEVVTDAGKRHERGTSIDVDDGLAAWEEAYHRRTDPELSEQDTLSWGRPELDERLGRMVPGAVFVPAGWTKHGKTWFVMDVAEAVMEAGHRVLIDSGEMSHTELLDRWVAMGGHNYTAVQEGRIPFSVMEQRRRQMRKWKLRTLHGRLTMARLRSQVTRAKLEGRPYRLVIVDHLGLVRPGPGEGRNGRREFVEDFCAEFKSLAEEFGFTGLLVSQLSRPAPEKGANPRWLRPPAPSDLKEASGIEQIATAVIFVYRHMDKDTGKFVEQKASLLFPFHRSRPQPDAMACEFALPTPAFKGASGGTYRFVPTVVSKEPEQASPEVAAVQEQLIGTFGPGVTLEPADDDEIPF